jgi:Ni,Fe-hydrogenase III large subunit/Ni,Fe-hydrogenase III component G
MTTRNDNLQLQDLIGAIPASHGDVAVAELRAYCQYVHDSGGRLVALWGSDEGDNGHALHVALINESGLVCLHVSLPKKRPAYPDLSDLFPAADRMQRAVYDLSGILAEGAHDQRKWLRHAAWDADNFPLRKDFVSNPHLDQDEPNPSLPPVRGKARMGVDMGDYPPPNLPPEKGEEYADDYPFVQVEGQGVHEIPVGPVHAGIIEPGHFRFSIVGEKVLRLEERLGYTHKGIEKRFESTSLLQGAKLAGRVSGDSTVAYAWAYAMAAESIAGVTPPERALWLRALLLERERVANHLGDLGYLGNDVALSFGFTQFWILKEQVLRTNAALFGHRYLMDAIVPGGVAVNLDASGKAVIEYECEMLEQQIAIMHGIYDVHAGVQDRYIGTGCVAPKLAAQLGLCGLAGRASAQAWDTRVQFPCAPYDKLEVQMATHRNGDVAARVSLRFDELTESLRLQRKILANLLGDDIVSPIEKLSANSFGIGMVEGWRGEVLVAIHTDANGYLTRVHPHDPSWQNWPALEHAILDNIVPDFPLINKSLNLSYSGVDL